jgi:hypothetical protein
VNYSSSSRSTFASPGKSAFRKQKIPAHIAIKAKTRSSPTPLRTHFICRNLSVRSPDGVKNHVLPIFLFWINFRSARFIRSLRAVS